MEQAIAFVNLTSGLIVAHCIISRYFVCFATKLGQFAYTTDIASMAQRNGSQLDADAVEPKTMAIARLKYPPALNPKAPVRSAFICRKRKHALISAVPGRIGSSRKEIRVLYMLIRNFILVVPYVMG